ncbi:MAG: aspartate/glutamate racemase family protein [Lachnospiraceae bacterium]|nr:aspartate/glutamate racemase family protein [Ruminococcus sp.]MCM1274818.1 aspartate/glutamate racemase family protein [Lachnospiraceae bacterium]
MKTIGLIGGMSWESTVSYYRVINETVNRALGGLHSAEILMYSVDFAEIEDCQSNGNWAKSADILGAAAASLQRAGADFIVICTNTMHKVADEISAHIGIPIMHIADAAADALLSAGVTTAALLGTKYTMQQDFYKQRLAARGISVLIPDDGGVELVNRVIYDELCRGIISPPSRDEYVRIIGSLKQSGARAVILGCTEIGMLINSENSPLPVFDTTVIHAERAALFSLEK